VALTNYKNRQIPLDCLELEELVDVTAVGDTVTWDTAGAQLSHTATADDGSWNSGYMTPGSKWTHTFDKPGEIHYHCEPHPWKKGVIRVK
jgi:plastocyanin